MDSLYSGKNLFTGLETVDFQGISKPGLEMVDLFNSVIEKRNAEPTDVKRIKRVQAEQSNLREGLTRICKQYFNIELRGTHFFSYRCGQFAMLPFFADNSRFANEIMDGYTGTEMVDVLPETAEELEEVAEKFNKSTCMVTKNKMVGSIQRGEITCTLYFDPFTAFLIKEVGNKNTRALTAEEITSIVLHEIGHLLIVVEHCADKYHQAIEYTAAVDHFTKYASLKEQMKYAVTPKDTKDLLSKKQEQTLQAAQRAGDEVIARESNFLSRAIVVFGSVCLTLYVSMMFLYLAVNLATSRTVISLVETLNVVTRTKKGKRSDQIFTLRNMFLNERNADEFAVRHGFGEHLIAALKTLHDNHKLDFVGANRYNAESTLLWHLASLPDMILIVAMGDSTGGGGVYEKQLARASRIIQGALKALKEEGCPEPLMDHYIKQYENTLSQQAKLKKDRKLIRASETVWNILEYWESPQSIIKMIVSGRLTDEYRKLLDDVDKIKTNRQYYHAAKFKQLGR